MAAWAARPVVPGVDGTWKDLTDSVNSMAGNLTGQVRNIAEVTTAVARGDLSRKITVDVKGEILELKNTTATPWWTSSTRFASEVTRVARESWYGRQVGRPGPGSGCGGHLEGSDRHGECDGGEPDRTGSRHRQGCYRGCGWRTEAEFDRQIQRRGGGAGRNHQQHDRDAGDLCRPGHDRGPRSRRGGSAGWAGKCARRIGNLEGPDRQRELAGGQPDDASARDCRSRDRGDQG